MQPEIDIVAPKFTSYQKEIIEAPERFTITEAATKTGKTFSHLWWLFKEAHLHKPNSNHWWIAPVYSQSEMAFKRLARVIANTGGKYKINYSKLFIETPKKTFIHFKSAEKPDNLYGDDVYSFVFDEFTRAREQAWFALRTTITATNGRGKFIGNVKGKKNWGYKLGVKAKNGEPNYRYFKITAYDAARENIIDIKEIEQAKRDLPDYVFSELYLAEPSEAGANPFGINFIKSAIKPISTRPVKSFGIDLAKSVDWTVIIGLDENGDVCFFDRFQNDWKQTREKILLITKKIPTLIDSTGVGDPIVEELQRQRFNVEGFKFTSNSKQQLIEGLVSGIQNLKTSVLEGIHESEMESFEFEYSKMGVKYTAPQGMTDDCVMAHALAFKKLTNHKRGLIYSG